MNFHKYFNCNVCAAFIMLKKFCEVSSCNGVVDLYEAKNSKCQFAFWAMVMTCMLGASVYFTYATIKGYMNTSTVTNLAIIPQKFMDLPDVAIRFNGGMNISAMLAANLSEALVRSFASRLYIEPTDDNNKEFKMFRLTHNLSMQDTYEKFSYRCDEMVDAFLFSSTYDLLNQNDFNCNQATGLWSESGIWYLFQTKGKQYTIMTEGINIILKELPLNFRSIYSDDQLIYLTMTNDYSIIMQKSFDNQISYEGIVFIPMNSAVSVVLNPKRYVRLSKCDSRNETYSSNTCMQNCYQAAMVESCKCRSIIVGTNRTNQLLDYCDLQTAWTCKMNQSYYVQCIDSCLPKCDEWVFEYQYSISTFRNGGFKGKSKATVAIFFDKIMYTEIEEVEAFTMDMAIANVGGQCGLWLGASFVTLIQAIYYLLLAAAEKMVKKKEMKVSVIDDNNSKKEFNE